MFPLHGADCHGRVQHRSKLSRAALPSFVPEDHRLQPSNRSPPPRSSQPSKESDACSRWLLELIARHGYNREAVALAKRFAIVLVTGELPTPTPVAGEVRVRLARAATRAVAADPNRQF